MASINLAAREYQPALDQLTIVEQAAPNDAMVHMNLAFAYGGLKKYAEAEREFQTALKLNPQYDGAAGEYVGMLFGLNQGPKALQVAKQYLDTNPNRAGAHFLYASALASSKKYDEAIPEYQKAIQMEPELLASYMQLASVYQLQGKPDDAIGTYQKALAVVPDNSGVLGALGNAYLGKGDVKAAQQAFEKANNLSPHDPLLQNNLAWVYAVQGQNLDVALPWRSKPSRRLPICPRSTTLWAGSSTRKGTT